MAADPLYDERGIALTGAECATSPRVETPDALPRPVEIPCDTQGTPLPEEFLPVKAPAASVPPPVDPPAFPIRNHPFTAVCAPPLTAGPESPVSYTIPAPLYHPPRAAPAVENEQGATALFRPAEVQGLTASQSAYITTSLQDPTRKAAVAAFFWDTLQVENDVGALLDVWLPITGWSSALSTIVITAALDSQAALNTTVQLLAASYLDCGYYNFPVTVCCNEGADAGYAEEPAPIPGVECVTVADSVHFSNVSQVEVNAKAVADAAGQLECIYWNALAEVSCETLYPAVFGPLSGQWPHTIITGLGTTVDLPDLNLQEFAVVGLPARVPLVYYAETAAHTVPAASQLEADTIAHNMALAQLNCFFPSDWLEVDCTTEIPAFTARAGPGGLNSVAATLAEVTYEGITTAHNEVFTQVTEPVIVDEQKTVYVTSPPGAFISTVLQSEATASAGQYAASLLECLWRSPKITCACYEPVTPDQDAYLYDDVTMAAALDKAPGLIAFNAEKSANKHEISAGAFVTPTYPGDELTDPDPWATAGIDVICLSYLSCIFCNVEIAPECVTVYKDLGAGDVDIVDLATLGGQTLPITIPDEYSDYAVSPTFKAGLQAAVVCDTDPGSVGAQADSLSRLKPSTDVICIYGNPELTVDCQLVLNELGRGEEFSELTTTAQALSVTVPENMFTAGGSTPEEAINAARDAAVAYGSSLLLCEFGNDQKTGSCDSGYDAALSYIAEVDADVFLSTVSKDDANQQATIYVSGQTQCLYGNDEQEESPDPACLPDETETKGKVAVNTFIMSSKSTANSAAESLAKALGFCDPASKINALCDFDSHPWQACVTQNGLNGLDLTVKGGYMLPCDAAKLTAPDEVVPLSDGKKEIWLKLTFTDPDGTGEKLSKNLTEILIETGDSMPADDATTTYRSIGSVTCATVGVAPDTQLEVTARVQNLFEDLTICEEEDDACGHSWCVAERKPLSSALMLTVESGRVTSAKGAVFDYPGGEVGSEGTVYLKLNFSSVDVLTSIDVESADTMPTDTETEHYMLIADITTYTDSESYERMTKIQRLSEDVVLQATAECGHSWCVAERTPPSLSLMLTVESGRVTSETGTVFDYPGGEVGGEEKVYLLLQYSSTNELTSIDVEAAATVPTDTATEHYMLIADITKYTDSEGYERMTKVQRLSEDVVLQATAEEVKVGKFDLSVDEVIPAASTGSTPTCTVTYKGGPFFSPPAAELAVADDVSRSACSGSYWLKVTRNSTSREATAADLHFEATGATPTADTETTQYIFLMEFDLTQTPIFWSVARSGVVAVLEQMILESGELKLATVDLAARYTYDPPAP